MRNSLIYARVSLVVALLLVGMSACFCAVGYVGIPVQQIETRAELMRSQSSGLPITDEDINTHLGRIESSRRIYGVLCVCILAAGLAIVAALGLLQNRQ